MRLTTREEILDFIRSRRIYADGRYVYQCEENAPRYSVNRDSVLYALFLHDWNYDVTNCSWIPVGPDVSEAHHGEAILTMAHEVSRKMDSLASDALDDVDALFMEALNTLPDSAVWVARENLRFLFGVYQQPLFIQQLRKLHIRIKDDLWWHFVHVSKTDPKMVALTQEHTKGQRDIQTPMKVGRYLQQFYSDVLTEQQIRAMANGVKQQTLKWATTAQEMEAVYTSADIHSCMAGRFHDLAPLHPVHVYDFEGQFKLAYLTDDVTNKIVARGLVHEPNKHWVRVYGDEATSLADMLNDAGYMYTSSWHDAYVACIEDSDGRVIMPYIDGDAKCMREATYRGKNCFAINDESGEYANRTDGFLTEPEPEGDMCGSCDEYGEETDDEMAWSDHHEIYIGRCCIDSYRFALVSRRSHDYVHEDECVYCESDGEHYLESYAEQVLRQTDSGDWFYSDEVTYDVDDTCIHVDDALDIEGVTFNRTDVCHAELVLVCTDVSTLEHGESPVRLIEKFDDTNEPYIVDDNGRKWLTNWATLKDMMDIQKRALDAGNCTTHPDVAMDNVVRSFNARSGFALPCYSTRYNYDNGFLN